MPDSAFKRMIGATAAEFDPSTIGRQALIARFQAMPDYEIARALWLSGTPDADVCKMIRRAMATIT